MLSVLCRYSTFPLNSLYAPNISFEELFLCCCITVSYSCNLASVMPSMCLFQFLLDFFKVELNVGGFIYLFIIIIIIIIILMFFRSQNFFGGELWIKYHLQN